MSPAGDAAHQKTLVEREKVTVMVLGMEVSMMVTEDVDQVLCAAATTAESLEHTTTRKMIAVRGLLEVHRNHHLSKSLGLTGVPGVSGLAAPGVGSGPGSRGAEGRSALLAMGELALSTPRRGIALQGSNQHNILSFTVQIYSYYN